VPITRRQFLQRTSVAAAAFAAPLALPRRVFGANDTIRAAVIGLGSRGVDYHIPCMENQQGVTVAALCDPDRSRLADALNDFRKKYGREPALALDMRTLLDRKDIDVVCYATQTYWHALGTIWACQAGKHVYGEKPACHYIWEGRQMVHAARKYDRIVQIGSQERSIPGTRAAVEWVRAGNLGKIKLITGFVNKPRASIGKRAEPLPIPPEVDYDLWCGPAQKVPLYRDRLHYDCAFDWNTGDGDSVGQGAHQMDVARWVLGETGLPRRVMSLGGRFGVDDAGNVANTQLIYYDFPSAPVIYEVHGLRSAKGARRAVTFRGLEVGAAVDCEDGYVMFRLGAKAYDRQGKVIQDFTGSMAGEFKTAPGDDDHLHFENFIDAIRAGDRAKLHAEILEGHVSASVCHTGNISYRLGRKASIGEIRQVTGAIPAWDDAFGRLLDHLKANEIALDGPTITLGPWLETVPGEEQFKDNPKANEIVRGWDREGFRIPEVKI